MNEAERKSIHALALRFAEGERAAFDPLFERLHPVVRAFAARRLGPADADDVAQEAMVKVFSRIVDLDPARDVVAWALGIAAYEALTLRRRRTRRREGGNEVDERAATSQPDPEEAVTARELLELLSAHIGTLAEHDRLAIERELGGELARGERDRKRRWRALERLRRFWRTTHG